MLGTGCTYVDFKWANVHHTHPHKLSADADGNPYCKYDSQALQWFTSSLFIAGVFAALPAGHVTK